MPDLLQTSPTQEKVDPGAHTGGAGIGARYSSLSHEPRTEWWVLMFGCKFNAMQIVGHTRLAVSVAPPRQVPIARLV